MKPEELNREGAGPPPLMNFNRAEPPAAHMQPRVIPHTLQASAPSRSKLHAFVTLIALSLLKFRQADLAQDSMESVGCALA